MTNTLQRCLSHSVLVLRGSWSHVERVLQEDNTELAYEFARKFRSFLATRIAVCRVPC